MYLPCIYHWDRQTETGRHEWTRRIWKMLFFGDYSVLQRSDYKDGKVFPTHHLIRPIYPHEVDLNQVRSLTFTTDADFYVHYFVLHPSPVKGFRFGMYIVGDETSDKVSIIRTDDCMRFHVKAVFLNEKFREAIGSVSQHGESR
jgi:hypothetical protein